MNRYVLFSLIAGLLFLVGIFTVMILFIYFTSRNNTPDRLLAAFNSTSDIDKRNEISNSYLKRLNQPYFDL